MRVLAVSVAPLFPDRVMGGSQRILMEAVDALAEAGHEVRVLSLDAGDADGFETPRGAVIEPVLELRGGFPAPYQTAPHRLTSAWRSLQDGAERADRAYLHADAIYMRAALGDLPIVRTLHDFVYEEALLSAFTLPAARTIVPSAYLRDCIEASAGIVTDPGELVVVPNGIMSPGWPVSEELPAGIELRRPGDLLLLHPHRLHLEKGIAESIQIAVALQERLPERRVRLLVPALQPDGSADEANLAGESVTALTESLGGADLLELHEWLAPGQMPGYLAAGDVTLCPGSFVEAFGLVPLESVAVGTPAVCARVGAFREQEGIAGASHFDYGDIDAAVDAVLESISTPRDAQADAAAVTERFDLEEMRSAYVDAITGPLPNRNAAASPGSGSDQIAAGTWQLAPWCYVSGRRIYHDYLARFEEFPAITALLEQSSSGEIDEASAATASGEPELARAKKLGFVVPARI